MRGTCCVIVALAALSFSAWADDPQTGRNNDRNQADETLVVHTYPVADLVVPLPPAKDAPQFAALEQHLKDVTGAAAWDEGASIARFEQTLSLIVRQTPAVHDQIAETIKQLRHELDIQCSLDVHVITGPRGQIAALADAFPGEFGKFEAEQFLQRVNESKTLNAMRGPKTTLFSGQTIRVQFDDRAIAANATVAADHRSITLKIAEGSEQNQDLLATVQTAKVHSGRSVALRFEAPRAGGIIPPATDAEERLVLVTARVIVVEEVEEKQPTTALLMVTPRGPIILEEEEELLGLPTE